MDNNMNAGLPYHRGVILQKGRGVGSVFSSLFRTLLPIGKAVIKSTPSIIKSTARSPIGRKLKQSAKKLALDTAKNLIETGDIKKTLKKSVDDSKKEIADAFKSSKDSKKRKLSSSSHCRNKKKYHLLKWSLDQILSITIFIIGILFLEIKKEQKINSIISML